MICIYDKKETDFTHNGLAVLSSCTRAVVKERLNAEYELELSCPILDKGAEYFEPFNIIKADGQLFRIYNIDKNSRMRSYEVYARHIFYDLAGYFVIAADTESVTCSQTLSEILTQSGASSNFTSSSDIDGQRTLFLDETDALEAIFAAVDVYRGELVRDNFNIALNKRNTTSNGFKIAYRKNMLSVSEVVNANEIVTGVYPIGKDGLTLEEGIVYSPYADSSQYPGHAIVKKEHFNARSEHTLRSLAESYLETYANLEPSYEVDMVNLSHTQEYKELTDLYKATIGDIVTVEHAPMGVDVTTKVIGLERDLLKGTNVKVELGKHKYRNDRFLDDLRADVDRLRDDFDSVVDIDEDSTKIGRGENGLFVADEDGLDLRYDDSFISIKPGDEEEDILAAIELGAGGGLLTLDDSELSYTTSTGKPRLILEADRFELASGGLEIESGDGYVVTNSSGALICEAPGGFIFRDEGQSGWGFQVYAKGDYLNLGNGLTFAGESAWLSTDNSFRIDCDEMRVYSRYGQLRIYEGSAALIGGGGALIIENGELFFNGVKLA